MHPLFDKFNLFSLQLYFVTLNFICSRCLALKDTIVGYTDESGVTIPPLHPRCRCAIIYDEDLGREKKPNKPQPANKPNSDDRFVFDIQRFGIKEDLQEAMRENRVKGELIYPLPEMDFSGFAFDGGHPERFAPEEVRSIPNWEETCRKCSNNGYNE